MSPSIRPKASDAATERFHAESRAHVAKLAAEGRGREALAEGARLLGLDLSKPVEFRLISVGSMRLDREPPRTNYKA